MKALHALTREESDPTLETRGHEYVDYDSPKEMMEKEAEPWINRRTRDNSQKSNGSLRTALLRLEKAASESEPLP